MAQDQQHQGESSSCTGPALHLVTLMYTRQKEQMYITKMQLGEETAEPVNIDRMVQRGKDFTSFTEELQEQGVSIAGYLKK